MVDAEGGKLSKSKAERVTSLTSFEEICGDVFVKRVATVDGKPSISYKNLDSRGQLHDDWREIGDADIAELRKVAESCLSMSGYAPSVPRQMLEDLISLTASKRTVNPVLEAIKNVEWDGVYRLETIPELLGWSAPDGEDSEIERIYLQFAVDVIFLSPIQRMLRPQTVDFVPILIGRQGVGKSRFLRSISNVDYDTNPTNPRLYTNICGINKFAGRELRDEVYMATSGKLVAEWSECDQFFTDGNEPRLKSIMDLASYSYREPYARSRAPHPVYTVNVFTSNVKQLLTDVENRRYLPIEMRGGKFPYENVEYIRQLWAEAYYRVTVLGDSFRDRITDNKQLAGFCDRVTVTHTDIDPAVDSYCQLVKDVLDNTRNCGSAPWSVVDEIYGVRFPQYARKVTFRKMHRDVKKYSMRYGFIIAKRTHYVIGEFGEKKPLGQSWGVFDPDAVESGYDV